MQRFSCRYSRPNDVYVQAHVQPPSKLELFLRKLSYFLREIFNLINFSLIFSSGILVLILSWVYKDSIPFMPIIGGYIAGRFIVLAFLRANLNGTFR